MVVVVVVVVVMVRAALMADKQTTHFTHSASRADRQRANWRASKQASKKEGGGETKQRLSMRRMRMDAMPRGQGKTRVCVGGGQGATGGRSFAVQLLYL